LTILFQDSNQVPREKPVSLLPLLTILFILSYAMLTYLVIQQASTIDSQRVLIRQLLGDSLELSAMKGKAAQPLPPGQSQVPAQIEPQPQAQPQPPVKSTQPKSGAAAKAQRGMNRHPLPERPSKNTGVVLDARRVTFNL
jgi:hypothetical protein